MSNYSILARFMDRFVERVLLGLILDLHAVPEALRDLEPEDWSDPLHRAIYTAMCALHDRGQAIDVGLLLLQVRRDETLDRRPQESLDSYLQHCLDLRPAPGTEHMYVQRFVELAGKRKLWLQALRFMRDVMDTKFDDLPAEEVRAHHVAALGALKLTPRDPSSATWADLEGLIGPVAWDWPGWLPRGFLTILAGEAGLGKSTLALRLCACYLRGDDWPDGAPGADMGRDTAVLWCETEAAQALNWERARAWGLPLERILTPLGPLEDVSIDAPAHQAAIARAAHRPEVGLVVVDSFSGAGHRNESSSEGHMAVRRLAVLARDTGKAVLLLHHLRKRSLLDAGHQVSLERLRGHSSIVQPARVVLALDAPNPYRETYKRLSVIKSNLAPFPQPLGFWVAEDGKARFALASPAPRSTTALERAAEALQELLSDGPVPAEGLVADLVGLGISEPTVRRAKARLGIVSSKREDGWTWELPSGAPGQGDQGDQGDQDDQVDHAS
jgi:putative DNA primase/helicase